MDEPQIIPQVETYAGFVFVPSESTPNKKVYRNPYPSLQYDEKNDRLTTPDGQMYTLEEYLQMSANYSRETSISQINVNPLDGAQLFDVKPVEGVELMDIKSIGNLKF